MHEVGSDTGRGGTLDPVTSGPSPDHALGATARGAEISLGLQGEEVMAMGRHSGQSPDDRGRWWQRPPIVGGLLHVLAVLIDAVRGSLSC